MKRIRLLAAVALATVSACAAPASAQGIPVIDPGNIAQTVKVVQNGIQQVQQMQAQLKQMTSMASTIGSATNGLPSAFLSDLMKNSGLNFSGTTSPLAQYRSAMPGLLDALPGSDVGKSLNVTTDMATNAKTDINAGRQFALNAFYKPGNASVDDIESRKGVRQAAMRDSATAGYAMAVYTKNNLTTGEATMKSLSDGVSKAADLRGDVQSNSAVAIEQLHQITVQNQLLAQLLEVQSATSMASDGTHVQ